MSNLKTDCEYMNRIALSHSMRSLLLISQAAIAPSLLVVHRLSRLVLSVAKPNIQWVLDFMLQSNLQDQRSH